MSRILNKKKHIPEDLFPLPTDDLACPVLAKITTKNISILHYKQYHLDLGKT